MLGPALTKLFELARRQTGRPATKRLFLELLALRGSGNELTENQFGRRPGSRYRGGSRDGGEGNAKAGTSPASW